MATARDPLSIALVGTRGVPARYGGFETCVEEVGTRLAARGHDVLVYCRTVDGVDPAPTYRGMRLVHLPALRRRSLETVSHTALSVAHQVVHRADAAVVFNAANAPLLPVLRAARVPVATHVDGLEWKRAKWGGAGRRYYRTAEALAVRWSDALVADAAGIADYYAAEFGAATERIAYGAPLLDDLPADRLAEIGLRSDGYHLVVARFEPENHVDLIVEGYRRSRAALPLVVVGSAPYADEYTRRVQAAADGRVRLLGGVWDAELLDQLYHHARTYLHGHSVGGTNPSLLRAIGAGAATVAFDVGFNREVLREHGRWFATAADVARAVEDAEADPAGAHARGRALRERARDYDWDAVADGYEDLCRRLAARAFRGRRRPSGRRRTAADAAAGVPAHAARAADAVPPDDLPDVAVALGAAPPGSRPRGATPLTTPLPTPLTTPLTTPLAAAPAAAATDVARADATTADAGAGVAAPAGGAPWPV